MTYTIYFANNFDFDFKYSYHTKTQWYKWYRRGLKLSHKEAMTACDHFMKIKIGLTGNPTQRQGGIDCQMRKKFQFEGTYADALFLEGYIRTRIEHHYSRFNLVHYGNDHFKCFNSNIIRFLENHFEEWCQEGYNLLRAI